MLNWTTSSTRPFLVLKKASESLLRALLVFLVGVYRTFGSQFLGGQCRVKPSCSHYCFVAFQKLPVFTALRFILIRILKCHPFSSSVWDPVPTRKELVHDRKQSAAKAF